MCANRTISGRVQLARRLLKPADTVMNTTPSKTIAAALALAAGLLGSSTSEASDHIDGLKTSVDQAADLTDLFAFTSPQDPSKLVLIMNAHTLALKETRFSNAVDYKFRIRPIDARTNAPTTDASKERSIVCTFSGGLPLVDAKQRGTCTFHLDDGDETIAFDTRSSQYSAGGEGAKNGIRVFAGVRSDPWFLDLAKTLKLNAGLKFGGPGTNGLNGQNILSIVVEVDKSRLPALLAVVAQTVRK
jgi:hypothetical protein